MLTKLFKHEMRATARIFIWLYIAFAAIAVVNALAGPGVMTSIGIVAGSDGPVQTYVDQPNILPNALQGAAMFLYGLAIAAIMIVTYVVVILRFYRNLLGDEGYLMMTLPVRREQLILSKFFAAMIWFVCSTILVILSFLLLISVSGAFSEVGEGMNELATMGTPIGWYISCFVLMILVGCAASIMMLYAAMAIGPNLLKHRVIGSILAYIIISIVSQLIYFGVLAGIITSLMKQGTLLNAAGIANIMPANSVAIMETLTVSTIIYYAAIAVACWFLSCFMLKRKLNLA